MKYIIVKCESTREEMGSTELGIWKACFKQDIQSGKH